MADSNKKRQTETFICDKCEEEHETEFRYFSGFVPIEDPETGFDSGEIMHIEICGNCDNSAVAGIVPSPQKNNSEEDYLPF